MFYVLQNESVAARRRVPILLTDAATGTTAQAGVALTTIYAYVNSNGGSFAGGAGTVANSGFGQYYYEFHPDEIDTLGLAGIHVTAATCRDYDAIAQVAALDFYSAAVGITAGSVWNYVLSNSDTAETNLVNASAGGGATAYAIAQEVWTQDITGYASPEQAGFNLYQLGIGATGYSAGGGISAYDVWNYTLTNTQTADTTITDIQSQVTSTLPTSTAASVWSYTMSNSQLTENALIAAASGVTAGDIWEYDISAISTAGTAGSQLNLSASGGAGLTAGDIWDFNIIGFGSTNSAAQYVTQTNFTVGNIETYVSTQTPQDVWTYAGIEGRTITGGAVSSVLDPVTFSSSQYSAIASSVWNAGTRTITGGIADTVTSVTNPVNVSTTSMSGIANSVWSTLTAPYTVHGTYGHQVLRSDNAATIGEVTLHQSGGSKRVDADVHAFVNNTASATAMLNILTGIGASITSNITGNLSGSVGSVTNPVSVTTASMTGIAGTVWSTDVSGYSSPSAGFDLANASAGGGISAYDVWNFDISTGPASPSASYYINNINTEAQSAATDASTAASNTNDIGGTVWASDITSYVTPGEAGFELTQAAAGSGLTTGDVSVAVWDADPINYSNNSTFGKGILRSDNAGVAGTVTLWTGASLNGVYADAYRIDADYGAATALKNVLTGIGSSITSNITGDLSGSVGSVTADVNLSAGTQSSIANSVWATDISGYTSPSAGYDLSNVSTGSGLTAGDVWTYATRTVTGGTITSVTNPVDVSAASRSSIASTVWNQDLSTYNTGGNNPIGQQVIIQNQGAQTLDRVIGLGATVWEYATRTLTSGGSGISAFDVWNFVLSDSNTAEVDLVQAAAGSGLTAGDVWSAPSRTITGGIADTVSNVTGNVSGSVGSVLGNVSGNVVGSVASVTGNVSGNVVGSVANVTGNVSGNVVGSVASVTGNVVGSVGSVTGNVAGSVNSVVSGVTVTTNNDKTGYALSANQTFNVTGNVSGNILGTVNSVTGNVGGNVLGSVGSVTGNVSGNVVGSVGSVTGNVSGNVVGSVGSVTGNVAGTVGAVTGNVNGNVVGSVASVTNPVTFSSAQYASIASSVWNAGTRTLTSGGSGISAYDVWNFVLSDTNTAEVDLVQAASGAGLTAGDVWTYGSREITGGLADTVTSLTNPVTVGTNNDKTGYALSAGGVTAVQSGLSTLTQAQVGTEVDSSLSDVGLTSTVTGRIDVAVSSRLASSSYEIPPTAASIASSVWSAGSRTITGGTVDNLTNPATVATSSMTGIAGTVWNYSTRTITSGGGATAGDVWTYPTRSLTSGAGITVNAATNIINGPYFVKSNVDGQDGNLDVITGMVQDIQLTVTDAFGNPFDTTALGLAVNFYNQAGTLTTSYGTSQLYGPAGLVQFTLDTAVTGVEGRYNLILSAAGAGNTIKFGPLTTLVRPY